MNAKSPQHTPGPWSTDFSFLKTWIDHPNPRPVVLECVPSRSGLSLSVYDREKLLYRVNGCGFDRHGTALAIFLEKLFDAELKTLTEAEEATNRTARFKNSGGWGFCTRFKGLHFNFEGDRVSLEGAAGIESMREIAEAIGLSVQVHETRSSTLLIIQRRSSQ